MSKFLNTSATNYFLEELIKEASERLILISPFLKLNDRIKQLLEDKDRLKIDVRVVYGKNELQPEEINWLKELTYVRTSFCKNLHAKCYLNEESCIVTSMNLYEFSQINNNEMGIHFSRTEDAALYMDAFEEAQRIIRISDEIRMSLEKVPAESEGQSIGKEITDGEEKISTSKVAKKYKLKNVDLLEKLVLKGYLEIADEEHKLTSLGKEIGGELCVSKRFGEFFKWPVSLSLE